MRKLFLATLVFLTGAGLVPPASAAALPRVVLPAGVLLHMRPVVRPAIIGIPNDGAGWTRSITWSTWGEQRAIGHGWGYFHTCKPNCDEGFGKRSCESCHSKRAAPIAGRPVGLWPLPVLARHHRGSAATEAQPDASIMATTSSGP